MRWQVVCFLGAVACGHDPAVPNDGATLGSDHDAAVTMPTASSWLGVNVSGDLPWTDITNQLTPFTGQHDPNGYPLPGTSGTSQTDIGFVLPTGSYKISYKGTGTLAVSGIATLSGLQTVGDEHRGLLAITGTPGAFGNLLTLAITNTAAQTVTDVHIWAPGIDYDTDQIFAPQLLALLRPFHTMRFMDWEATNNSTIMNWADRATATQFGSNNGVPFERIAELINTTGKDGWITIPEHATDDYIHQLAQFMASHLDFVRISTARQAQGIAAPFQLLVENSNENWNTGFSAYATFLGAAQANPGRYTGVYDGIYPSFMSGNSNLMKVGQYEADRLVKIGMIFRQEFAGNASAIAPVLAGWALAATYSDVGLRFILANYGDPKQYVSYIAHAPYFSPDDAQTGSLASLFASASANIQAMDATFQSFAKLGSDYGIAIAAYEGGQGMGGTTNQTIKHLSQHDQRMYDTYNAYYALWRKDFGTSLFCHFTLAETPGVPESLYQYGYWGSIISIDEDAAVCGSNLPTLMGTEDIASVVHHCPKYRALAEQALE
jgi:hypothetical protein